ASSSHIPILKSSEYYADLCKAFLSSDIPLYKLKSPELRTLLTKYTNFETPAESTLRKLYVHACYEKMLGKIQSRIDIPLMKYARLSSCDVERSFSRYRALFRDNRHRIMLENLEKVFIIHCNSEFFQPSSDSTWW
ncbi:hypothetical protein C0J52_02219, partial [Blattella germanica]